MRPSVRVVYLVPADRKPRKDYARAIEHACLHIQNWYWKQLGREATFRLLEPLPAIVRMHQNERWFATNPRPSEQTQWYWENLLGEAFARTRAKFDDPKHRWIFYADAEHDPGQSVGAAGGLAVLPEHDLRGLLGEAQPGHIQGVPRWIGGLGHELGHALGLPHPPACEKDGSIPEAQCLMWVGYAKYPETFFLPEEKKHLLASPFLTATKPLRTRF